MSVVENSSSILPPWGTNLPLNISSFFCCIAWLTINSQFRCYIVDVLLVFVVFVYLKDLSLFLRLQQMDEENSELRSCVPCLRANIERLEEVRTIISHFLVWLPSFWFYCSIKTHSHTPFILIFFVFFYFPGEKEAARWDRSHVWQTAGRDRVPQEDGWQAEPWAPPEPEGEGVHSGGGTGLQCTKQTVICLQNIKIEGGVRQHQCHVSNVPV